MAETTVDTTDAAAVLLGDDSLTGEARCALAQLLIAAEFAPGSRAHEALRGAVTALTAPPARGARRAR